MTTGKILDDLRLLRERDPGGMLETLASLPEQCEAAWSLGEQAEVPDFSGVPSHVVVAGMGGSAIGGDLVRILAEKHAGVPVIVSRGYQLPAFIDQRCLVFLISYSGNTEETLCSYDDAGKRKASRIAVTAGGKLAELAHADGVPVVKVPPGLPPRSAIGYLFLPVFVILQKMGIFSESISVEELVTGLKELRARMEPASPLSENPAKQLALRLYGKIPVVYGVSGTTEVVALRWKGQFNENAKCLAYWNAFPEMNHNEIVGFEAPEDLLKSLELVFLRDESDHPRIQARMEITKRILRDRVSGISDYWGEGGSFLTRLFSLIYLGDYASVYLALLYGINPKPVAVIDYLKRELAKLP